MANPADDPPRPDATCSRCAEPVAAATATCPHCGHSVEPHNRRRLVYGLLGTALTLSVVGAPLGISLLWLAVHHRRQYERGVGGEVSELTLTDVSRTLRQQLSLDPGALDAHPHYRDP